MFLKSIALVLMLIIPTEGMTSTIADWIIQSSGKKVGRKEANQIRTLVFKYGKQYRIDPQLILRIIYVESRFNRKALSKSGAIGLMQVMPKWHPEFANYKLYSIPDNIHAGVQVLSTYRDLYGYDKMVKRYSGKNGYAVTYARRVNQVALWNKGE